MNVPLPLAAASDLDEFFDSAAMPMHWVGPDGTILRANQAELDMLGYSQAEYIGRPIAEFHADPQAIDDILRRLSRGETLREYPARLRCKDGSVKEVRITSNVRWHEGRFLHTRCFTRDVSDQARAEALRLQTEDYLEGLLEGFVAYDANWVMTYMNAAAERMLGRRRAEVIGRTWHEAFPHAVGNAVDLMYQRVMRTREPERMEHDYRRPYGKWFEISASPVQGGGVSVHFRDITDRHAAEESLRESEERLRLALEAGRMGTWAWHIPTGKVSWSPALEALHGLPAGAFDGSFAAFERDIHAEDRDYVRRSIAQTLEHDSEHHLEYRIVLPDGTLRWVEGRGKLFRDAAGQPERMIGVCADITARKNAEQAMRAADRRKDEFLATLAHELRNPLAPIQNAVRFLKAKGPASPDLAWAREVIERQLAQMARLLDDLLDVNRIARGTVELRRAPVTLAAVLESAMETSRPLVERGRHALSLALPPEPVWLDADAVRLAQVFSNLLNNAARYTPEGGRIEVGAVREDGHVAVSVRDSGIGIDAEMLPRVFEMFSQAAPARLRSPGGLGIGLSLARALVELHGGSVQARSDGPGKGSEFVVRLPALEAGAQPRGAAQDARPFEKRRIVVADDLRDSTDTLASVLTTMGHEVHAAYDGEEAVAAVQKVKPDVVLLDLGMPKVDGYEACRRIRSQPDGKRVKIVALTGWGQEEDRRRSADAGFDCHLVKPADPDALAKLL